MALVALMAFSAFGCSKAPVVNESESSSSSSEIGEEEYVFESVLGAQETKNVNVDADVSYDIKKDISGKEYVKIVLETNVPLLGEYTYSNIENPSEVVKEEFFIEPSDGEIVFKQFFDSFREDSVNRDDLSDVLLGSLGDFDKVLESIRFTNKGNEVGVVTLKDVSVTERNVPEFEKELYIQDGYLKVGADLACGGILTYLERVDYGGQTIDEVIDKDGNVVIGINAKEGAARHLSSSVNLINAFDPGREFQQSYYSNVGGTSADNKAKVEAGGYSETNKPADYGANGYNRGWSTTAGDGGHFWPYNPVQGGNMFGQVSQIVDYEVSETEIYVKVRAMDWAIRNTPTKSYMENWYTIKNNMVYVTNRFIDWNGFTDMDNVSAINQELPAAYVVQPLHNYVCYTGSKPWTEETTNMDIQPELGFWGSGSYVTDVGCHKEDWFAWVNDDMFGVGVYVPGMDRYASGRVEKSTSALVHRNSCALNALMATTWRYNKKEAAYPEMSCYVANTCYTAPVIALTMRSYKPMSYQYVIAVDDIATMRSQFYQVYSSGEVTNEGLNAWK